MNDVTKWYTAMVTLESMIEQISADDYPTLANKLKSALEDVKALLISAIG